MVAVLLPEVNAVLVVSAACRIPGEALGQVPAVAVHMEFLPPEVHHAFCEVLRGLGLVVVIEEEAEAVGWGLDVEERVGRGGGIALPPHQDLGIRPVAVVEHHVEDDGNAALMAGVDEFLELVLGPVRFVDGEIEGWVVAPAVVAVELVDGHEFEGGDVERAQVIERVENELEGAFLAEVPDEQLVYDEVLLRRALEVAIGPLKLRTACLEDAHRGLVGQSHGVVNQERIGRLGNPVVVPVIELLLGVRIREAVVVGHDVVLVAVLLVGVDAGELDPEPLAIGRHVHHEVLLNGPIGQVPDEEHVALARSKELQDDGRAVGGRVESVHRAGGGRGYRGAVRQDDQIHFGGSRFRAVVGGEDNGGGAGIGRGEVEVELGGVQRFGQDLSIQAEGQMSGFSGGGGEEHGVAGDHQRTGFLRLKEYGFKPTGTQGEEDVAPVGVPPDEGSRSVAEDHGQLFRLDPSSDPVEVGQGLASEIVAPQVGAFVVHDPLRVGTGPRHVHVLPIGRRGALGRDQSGVDVDGNGALQLTVAFRRVVIQGHLVVDGGEGWVGPDDLSLNEKGQTE